MDLDAWTRPAPWHRGDLRKSGPEGPKAPEGRCRAMGEHGARTGSERGSHPESPAREDPVADGVDAAVHSLAAAALDAASYRSAPQPEVVQLSAGNHAMLAPGETRDRPFPVDNVNRCIY